MPGPEVGAATLDRATAFNAAGRALRGCERGATVERSETGERTMFAPAGQTTARAGQLCWLAALAVRRQAPGPYRAAAPARLPGGVKTPPYKASVSGSL